MRLFGELKKERTMWGELLFYWAAGKIKFKSHSVSQNDGYFEQLTDPCNTVSVLHNLACQACTFQFLKVN